MLRVSPVLLILLLSLFSVALQAEQPTLHPKLEPFRPYLDTYWQGDLTQSDGAEKMIDRSHWQRALNGNAIKTVHSINDGVYGGESIIYWDEAKQSLSYYYFTTAGFYTHGSMTFEDNNQRMIARETVENNANGITLVESVSTLNGDVLTVSSRYLQNGEWVTGHSASYRRVAPLEVKFK